jgi:hypothetical protein
LAKDIKDVDNIEDCLIEVVQSHVKSDEAFFVTACGCGSLPQEWIEKVFNLITPPVTTGEVTTKGEKVLEQEKEKDEEVLETALTKATTEKPLTTRRYLATTRRAHLKTDLPPSKKKALAKTRRQTTKPTAA